MKLTLPIVEGKEKEKNMTKSAKSEPTKSGRRNTQHLKRTWRGLQPRGGPVHKQRNGDVSGGISGLVYIVHIVSKIRDSLATKCT